MSKRNIHTNGELVRRLRNSLGWTQRELARRAGYTDRLVRKAEGGGRLDFQTAIDLADALSSGSATISADDLDMDRSLVGIAERIVRGPLLDANCRVQEIELLLSPDFVLVVAGDPSRSIFAGTWRGFSGLSAFLDAFHETIWRDAGSPDVVFTSGESLVSARYLESFSVNEQPIPPFWVNLHFRFSGAAVRAIDAEYDTLWVAESCRERRINLSKYASRLLARHSLRASRA